MSSFLLGSNGLVITNGILQTGPSNTQEINILLNESYGSIRSAYDLGIGIFKYTNSKDYSGLKSEIQRQCSISGNAISDVIWNGTTINIVAVP